MSTAEIAVPDTELEELMAQLEMETGVTVAPSPPPPAVAKPAVALSAEDELLAALEEPTTAPTATVAPVLETAATATVIAEATAELSADDELAALEAELGTTATITTETTVREPVIPVGRPTVAGPTKVLDIVSETSDSEDRGMSFIPGQVLVEPEKLAVAPVAEAGKNTAPSGGSSSTQPPFDIWGEPPASGLNFFTDPNKFTATTSISDNDLDRCMLEQNGLRSHYGTQAARAERQAARCKLKFEVIEATLYEEHRRLAAEEGEKVTEKALENRVKSDPRWAKAKMLVIDAAGISDINRALVESLRDRKDMLVQLGADRRDEMKGQARIMAEAGAAASLAQRAVNAVKEQQQ